ncbi:MAG: hypothetical protein HYR91_03540 [Flavobacteriia bacterium]|nr:hypothetical protein [Flavobacteriia bacterium]
MKRILYLSLLLCIFQSCQYQSFLRYYFPTKKTNFPHFSKWDELIGSNSNPLRSCYDVKFYDWTVHTYPEKKMIQSEMKIVFEMQCEQDTVLFDFQNHLKMDSLKCSEPLKKIIRKKDVIFLIFKQVKTKNKTINLDISYHGTSVKILSYTAIN